MTGHDDAVEVIAREIERYLAEHPRAGDTVEGIRAWWLAGGHQGSLPDVLMALESLTNRGVVQRRALPDGTTVYSSATGPGPAV